MRLATLREFISFIRKYPGVWFGTCAEVAQVFADQEADSHA